MQNNGELHADFCDASKYFNIHLISFRDVVFLLGMRLAVDL